MFTYIVENHYFYSGSEMFKRYRERRALKKKVHSLQDSMESEFDNAIDKLPFRYRLLYNISFTITLIVYGAGIFPIREYLITYWNANELVGLIAAVFITFTPFLGPIIAVWASYITSFQLPIWIGIIYFIILPVIARILMNYLRKKAVLQYLT
jgi:hypothetical protein